MTPTIGRIVHYVMTPTERAGSLGAAGQHRPAIIIAPCNERFNTTSYTREECQLAVFIDGSNDIPGNTPGGTLWATSVPHDEDCAPGTWHWPERV
jgi:hypothetical protein